MTIKPERINIIYGENASGKTNLIEGLFVLLNGHSFTKRNMPLKMVEEESTLVHGRINDRDVDIIINRKDKVIKLDKKKADIVTLKKMFPSLLFSLETFLSFNSKAYLFSLIDRMAYVDDEAVMDKLIEYKKLVKIKRAVLSRDRVDSSHLGIINRKLIDDMNYIINSRKRAVGNINNHLDRLCMDMGLKPLKIIYKPESITDPTPMEIAVRKSMLNVNRSGLKIALDGRDIFVYSSVGEKKIALLLIVVSIAIHSNRERKPVLLIDDLEGDLDSKMRSKVFDLLVWLPNQLFLTTLGEYLYNKFNIIEVRKELAS